MKIRRRLCLLLVFLMLFVSSAAAEGGFIALQDNLSGLLFAEDNGGALSEKLGTAYLSLDAPYLVKGERAAWTFVVSDDAEAVYQYAFDLYVFNLNALTLTHIDSRPRSAARTFSSFIQRTGRYIVRVTVYEGAEKIGFLQSPVYEAVERADEADETTIAGKTAALAKQCLAEAGSSEYARALWMHDWLIYNANYDDTYTYYYADGVLLHGTGVCSSYAHAYQMLLKAIGMDCLLIEGTTGDAGHAWNLVSIDGQWYHVDCTWDDPEPGGHERHTYFGLTDALMRRDHAWSEETPYPVCIADAALYDKINGAYFVGSEEEMKIALEAAIAAEAPCITLCSSGSFAGDFDTAVNNILVSYHDAVTGIYAVRSSVQTTLYFAYHYSDFYSEKKPTRLSMHTDSLLLAVGGTDVLSFTHQPQYLILKADESLQPVPLAKTDFAVEWRSDAPDVVSVENGRLTALKAGIAVITVSCGEVGASCLVRVTDAAAQLSLPAKTGVIKESAFAGCVSFTSAVLPDGLQRIESRAFADCTALVAVTVPDSVTFIAPDAFDGCGRLLMLCHAGTCAEAFAEANGMDVKILK